MKPKLAKQKSNISLVSIDPAGNPTGDPIVISSTSVGGVTFTPSPSMVPNPKFDRDMMMKLWGDDPTIDKQAAGRIKRDTPQQAAVREVIESLEEKRKVARREGELGVDVALGDIVSELTYEYKLDERDEKLKTTWSTTVTFNPTPMDQKIIDDMIKKLTKHRLTS